MKRQPRSSTAKLTDRNFFMLMGLTGLLTASVAMGVYLYGLKYESLEVARTQAFAVLVFAELFRSFGCRSETKAFWEVGLFTNKKLVAVVAASLLFQVWSLQSTWLGSVLKTEMIDIRKCAVLIAIGAIPLLILELYKVTMRSTAPAKIVPEVVSSTLK